MKRRRNPDLVGTVLVLGAVGVGGYFLYKTVQSTINGQKPGNPSDVGNQLGGAAGSGLAGSVAGGVSGFLANADICTLIAQWRKQGSPAVTLAAIGSSSFGNLGGGDPRNYGTFLTWATTTAWYLIPPNTPPTCW